MLELGKLNNLTISDRRDNQLYLDGGELGEIPLADKDISGEIGEGLQVFVYIDGKNQVVATTQIPKALVDEIAWLKVVSLSHAGAFLDWGFRARICRISCSDAALTSLAKRISTSHSSE